jgi:hypothetical protein
MRNNLYKYVGLSRSVIDYFSAPTFPYKKITDYTIEDIVLHTKKEQPDKLPLLESLTWANDLIKGNFYFNKLENFRLICVYVGIESL